MVTEEFLDELRKRIRDEKAVAGDVVRIPSQLVYDLTVTLLSNGEARVVFTLDIRR